MLPFKISALLKTVYLFTASICIPLIANNAYAGCISSDINAQYIVGETSMPFNTQTNEVEVEFSDNCLGNSSHGNNFQLYSGSQPVNQERWRKAKLSSPKESVLPSITTPNIETNINQQLQFPGLK